MNVRLKKFLYFLLLLGTSPFEFNNLLNLGSRADAGDLTSDTAIITKAIKDETIGYEESTMTFEAHPFFQIKNSRVYKVIVTGNFDPPGYFCVAIGNDNIPYVFSRFGACRDHKRFSKVIAREDIDLSKGKGIIEVYISAILFFLDDGSMIVNSIGEIPEKDANTQNKIRKYEDDVKPLLLQMEDDRIFMTFYSWGRRVSSLRKWVLRTETDGEIISCQVEDLIGPIRLR